MDPLDETYFRQMMEKIPQVDAGGSSPAAGGRSSRLGRVLEPMQAALKRQAFMAGATPAYADYILFSVFQWARVMSP